MYSYSSKVYWHILVDFLIPSIQAFFMLSLKTFLSRLNHALLFVIWNDVAYNIFTTALPWLSSAGPCNVSWASEWIASLFGVLWHWLWDEVYICLDLVLVSWEVCWVYCTERVSWYIVAIHANSMLHVQVL